MFASLPFPDCPLSQHKLDRSIHGSVHSVPPASPLVGGRHISTDNGYGHYSSSSKEPTSARSLSVDSRASSSFDGPHSPPIGRAHTPELIEVGEGDERAIELLQQVPQ